MNADGPKCHKLKLARIYSKSDSDLPSLVVRLRILHRSEQNLLAAEVKTTDDAGTSQIIPIAATTVDDSSGSFTINYSSDSDDIILKPVHETSLVNYNINIKSQQNSQIVLHSEISQPHNKNLHQSSLSSAKGHTQIPSNILPKTETSEDGISRISGGRINYPVPEINSSMTVGGRRCRICMSVGTERLISPCHCKGSLGVMHVSCLERWLSTSGRANCELCGYSFPVVMTQRYSLYKALVIWLRFSRNRTTFMTDCLFFWTLTVLTASLVVCCVLGSKYFTEQGGSVGLPKALAEGMTRILLAVVLIGYAITGYVLWKDHASLWRRWRNATMDVRLVLEDLQNNDDVENSSKPSRKR